MSMMLFSCRLEASLLLLLYDFSFIQLFHRLYFRPFAHAFLTHMRQFRLETTVINANDCLQKLIMGSVRRQKKVMKDNFVRHYVQLLT